MSEQEQRARQMVREFYGSEDGQLFRALLRSSPELREQFGLADGWEMLLDALLGEVRQGGALGGLEFEEG